MHDVEAVDPLIRLRPGWDVLFDDQVWLQRPTVAAPAQAGPTEAEMKACLNSLGIPMEHLKKTTGKKLRRAFEQARTALTTPGKHKITLKLDKKYELKSRDGKLLSIKKKTGFWGKVGGALKKAADGIVVGACVALAPYTGGWSLTAAKAYMAVRRGEGVSGALRAFKDGPEPVS